MQQTFEPQSELNEYREERDERARVEHLACCRSDDSVLAIGRLTVNVAWTWRHERGERSMPAPINIRANRFVIRAAEKSPLFGLSLAPGGLVFRPQWTIFCSCRKRVATFVPIQLNATQSYGLI